MVPAQYMHTVVIVVREIGCCVWTECMVFGRVGGIRDLFLPAGRNYNCQPRTENVINELSLIKVFCLRFRNQSIWLCVSSLMFSTGVRWLIDFGSTFYMRCVWFRVDQWLSLNCDATDELECARVHDLACSHWGNWIMGNTHALQPFGVDGRS